jgi:CTP-dependent riboflavin kinase
MGQRFVGAVRTGYGYGAQLMSDPALAAKQAHHFTSFRPIPGTLNLLLSAPFDPRLFTGTITSEEMGGFAEDHRYAHIRIENEIPGFVIQTLNPGGDFPAEVVELVADRHLRTVLGLADGDAIAFEMAGPA